MLQLKLAYRNLIGAGLRTGLNVFVLSLAYIIIIWHQGLFFGMQRQGTVDVIKDEIAGGQYWQKNYDPYDPISLDEAHGTTPSKLQDMIDQKNAAAELIRQASIYPNGRVQSILLRGVDPKQDVLGIPTQSLLENTGVLPVMIGKRMAKKNGFAKGDFITIRWRDAKGVFDALEAKVVAIMETKVMTIDNGQIWLPLGDLQKMTGLHSQATLVVIRQNTFNPPKIENWDYKDHDFLLSDLHAVVRSKRVTSLVLYVILLFLAMLAVFDTQVLSIFRRRKEIGTLIALGMTRVGVIVLFTIEGMLNGVLAMAVGALYGIPILIFTAHKGIGMPAAKEDFGLSNMDRLFPYYPFILIAGTVVLVMITVTLVSYWPTRKIANLEPTEALRGKIT